LGTAPEGSTPEYFPLVDRCSKRMYLNVKNLVVSAWCLIAATASLSLAASTDLRLIQAVKNKDPESVRRLLKERVDVNAPQGDGSTALHWAAYVDHLSIADLLIRAGADVSAANDDGATPLHLACTNRSALMVARLLAAGANANAKLLNGETVLMTCARTGEAKTVQALLAHQADVNVKEAAHNQTALMWAAAERHPEVVRLLLAAGGDVTARSLVYPATVVGEQTQRAGREKLNYTVLRGGSTPLLFAAREGDVQSAQLLLDAGANVNDSLPDGMSALVLAAQSGHGEVGTLLLEKGANPNAADIGYSALHAATLRSDLNLVKALMAHGANPNLRMTKGTPVRRASADFNLPPPLIGSTPYLLAAKFLEPEIMRVLVAGGADPKITMPNGATPLMLAAGMGSFRSRRGNSVIEPESHVLETVVAAVNLGADINAVNPAGDTALHTAASKGYDTVVQFLADHGAQLGVKNKRGQTPLMAALTAGRGRGGAVVVADVDSNGVPVPESTHQSTAALLRKLGATE
jgi:ankyrin repeat protein